MFTRELETSVLLAHAAGSVILSYFKSGFEIEEKFAGGSYSEPVTIADRKSSEIIVAGLEKEFPDDAILSEEEVDDTERRLSSKRVWIIDPLDGTRGFTEKKGDFAVQIALVISGVPTVGVVFQPIGDVLYTAVRNQGAYLRFGDGETEKLRVSGLTAFEEMTMAVSRSHRSPKMDRIFQYFGIQNEYSHGSVGLKVGFLARQIADLYIHMSPHTKFWDTAAPQIILEEAGGQLTDIFGDMIDYTLQDVRNHNGIFASNGISHSRAIQHIRPLLTEFGRLRVTNSQQLNQKKSPAS